MRSLLSKIIAISFLVSTILFYLTHRTLLTHMVFRNNESKPPIQRMALSPEEQRFPVQSVVRTINHSDPIIFNQAMKELPTRSFLIAGYLNEDTDPVHLAIFCGTINSWNSAVDVILFAQANLSDLHKKIAKTYGATLIVVEKSDLSPNYLRSFPMTALKWELLYRILSGNRKFLEISSVLICNVNKYAFRRDPFGELGSNSGNPGIVVNHVVAADQPAMSDMSSCFGPAMRNLLQLRPPTGEGLMIGQPSAMLKFSKLMRDFLSGGDILAKNFPGCLATMTPSTDVSPAVFTVLQATGSLKEVLDTRNLPDNLFFNVPASPSIERQLSLVKTWESPTALAGAGGVIVAVNVPRSAELTRHLASRYVFWKKIEPVNMNAVVPLVETAPVAVQASNLRGPSLVTPAGPGQMQFQFHLNQQQQSSMACLNFKLFLQKDIFAGICDISQESGRSLFDCCSQCSYMRAAHEQVYQVPTCSGFAFQEGVCYFKSCDLMQTKAALAGAGSLPLSWMDPAVQSGLAALASASWTA